MSKRLFLCVAVGIALAPSFCEAAAKSDHLIPDVFTIANPLSEAYAASDARFFTVFGDGYGDDVVLRAMVYPSFSNEYLVGLRSTRDGSGAITGYRAFYVMPRIPLHAYESLRGAEGGLATMDPNDPQDAEAYKKQAADIARWKSMLPADPKDIPVVRCEKPLDNVVAEKIVKVWPGVLLGTHYDPESDGGLDGVTYDFYALGKDQRLAGWTWSPDRNSKPGMLVDVADTLAAYCEGKAAAADLVKKADMLARNLHP